MRKGMRKKGLLVLCALAMGYMVAGQVVLPKLISNGMVLQRDAEVKIWGWAGKQEKIHVTFLNNSYETITSDSGTWTIVLPKMTAGGPYDMTIAGTNSITVRDILIGDIWVCSGQSNMETTMLRVSPIYGAEIENCTNDNIRYFLAPQTYDFNAPKKDYSSGTWQKPDPKSILNFSAVAYFFAREINARYHVPVGIINTAIGGTPIEAWISEDAIKAFPTYYNETQRFKDKSLIEQIERSDREKVQTWYRELGQNDRGHKDPAGKWFQPSFDASAWPSMKLPGYWASTNLGPVNGVVWFRKDIEIPASMTEKPVKLLLGRIVDADSVFVNGKFVGATGYQYPPRRYEIPSGVLHTGNNTIAVKIISNGGKGGFVPDKPYELIAGDQKIDLEGDWKFQLGCKMPPMAPTTTIKYKPVGLFNAMIGPLLNLSIKGILWYQGESNAERPIEYRQLFPALVNDWRHKWNQNFPVLYVQLPNFMEAKDQPSTSNWALFRETQLKSLSIPNTAMAVTIDIGEWNDIHPLNKLDVGKRLALAAEKVAYGEDPIVYSGPVYQSMKVQKNKIILSFTHVGSGLVAKGDGMLKQFAITGSDKHFVWADARIKKDKVIVQSKSILNPVAVRYAWADNPVGANLYNKEGLPASPFRTDEW
jgi:sialate O-acetylesterase